MNKVSRRQALWLRFCQYLKRRKRILLLVRAVRAIWWLGPWRNFLIKYYQLRNRNPALHRTERSLFPNLNPNIALRHLNQDGYAPGIRLPEETVAQILNFCGQQDAFFNPHLDCPAVHKIAHDPRVLEVVKGYFGVEPVLYSSNLYWTWPPADEQKRQQALAVKSKFHYDVGDFKTLVVLIYMTDVDEECGPHQVIAGTHLHKKPLRLVTRYLNERDAYTEFSDQIKVITGARGTGFFEDLTCYHKHAVGSKSRLMLTICYLLRRTPQET